MGWIDKLIWLATALLGAWVVLWRALGDRWGWLGMLNAWAEWGRALLGGLALLGAARRNGAQSGAALALWAVGVSRRSGTPLVPWLLAKALPTAAEEGDSFKILCGNLYKFNVSAAEHLALIRAEQPDIVCFQELREDIAAEMQAALADEYPHHALRPCAAGRRAAYGFGVWSRFPVEETGYWERPGLRPWGQRVRVTLPSGEAVEVYNVHLVPPAADHTLQMGLTWGFRAREGQLRVMQQEMAARGLPACVVGDHNFADTSGAYLIAREAWADAWHVAGRGTRWTWPIRDFPVKPIPWTPRLLRLDYCFYNNELRATEMRVLTQRTGSDHCPFVVRLALDAPPH